MKRTMIGICAYTPRFKSTSQSRQHFILLARSDFNETTSIEIYFNGRFGGKRWDLLLTRSTSDERLVVIAGMYF